jgi:hypothetical protein
MWRLGRSARAETALLDWRVRQLEVSKLEDEVGSHQSTLLDLSFSPRQRFRRFRMGGFVRNAVQEAPTAPGPTPELSPAADSGCCYARRTRYRMTTDLRIPASAPETHTRSRALAIRFRFFVGKFVFAKQSHFPPLPAGLPRSDLPGSNMRPGHSQGSAAQVLAPKTLPASRAGDPPLPLKWQDVAIRVDEPDYGDRPGAVSAAAP